MGNLKDNAIADKEECKRAAQTMRATIAKNSKYITVSTGVPFVGVFRAYAESIDPRDAEKVVGVYTFNVEGKDKTLTCANKSLNWALSGIVEERGFGVKVELLRTGEGYETKYTVKVVE